MKKLEYVPQFYDYSLQVSPRKHKNQQLSPPYLSNSISIPSIKVSLPQSTHQQKQKINDRYRYRDINQYGDSCPYGYRPQKANSFMYGKQNINIKSDILERYKQNNRFLQDNKDQLQKHKISSQIQKLKKTYRKIPLKLNERLLKNYSDHIDDVNKQNRNDKKNNNSLSELYHPYFPDIGKQYIKQQSLHRQKRQYDKIRRQIKQINYNLRYYSKITKKQINRSGLYKKQIEYKKEDKLEYKRGQKCLNCKRKGYQIENKENVSIYKNRKQNSKPNLQKYIITTNNIHKQQKPSPIIDYCNNSSIIDYYPYYKKPKNKQQKFQFQHQQLSKSYEKLNNNFSFI